MIKINVNDKPPEDELKKALSRLCGLFQEPLDWPGRQRITGAKGLGREQAQAVRLIDESLEGMGVIDDGDVLARVIAASGVNSASLINTAAGSGGFSAASSLGAAIYGGAGLAAEIYPAEALVRTAAYLGFSGETASEYEELIAPVSADYQGDVPAAGAGAYMSPWEISQKMAFINSQNLLGKGVK